VHDPSAEVGRAGKAKDTDVVRLRKPEKRAEDELSRPGRRLRERPGLPLERESV
jgi:hypothetical protein